MSEVEPGRPQSCDSRRKLQRRRILPLIHQLAGSVMLAVAGCGDSECLTAGCSSGAVVHLESQSWSDGTYVTGLQLDEQSTACTFIVDGGSASGKCDDNSLFLILDRLPSRISIKVPDTPRQVGVTVSRDGVEIVRTMLVAIQYKDVTPPRSCSSGCVVGELSVSVPPSSP